MAEIKVDRTTADRISAMIREGVRVDDIAEIENIPKRLVSVLEHSIALREGEGTKLERLMDLLKENTLSRLSCMPTCRESIAAGTGFIRCWFHGQDRVPVLLCSSSR